MSTRSLSPRSRRPRPSGPGPLPALPRGLRASDLARGARRIVAGDNAVAIKIDPAELTTDTRGQLLARAEARWSRLQAAERRTWTDLFWLAAELRLALPGCHPKAVTRWRDRLTGSVRRGEWDRDARARLAAFVLAHEPATDAWLRGQLATLEARA